MHPQKVAFDPTLLAVTKQTLNPSYISQLDLNRGYMIRNALQFTADNNAGSADLGAALRMVLYSDQALMDELAGMEEDKGRKTIRNAYNQKFQRAPIDSDSGAGDNDFGELFVEKTIKKRVEADSDLLKMLDNKRLTTKTGKFPKSSNLAKAAFAALSDNLVDLTTTVDAGFDNTELEAQKFGGFLTLEQDAFVKLDAQIVSQILDELTIAHHRGMIDQIVNGPGTGVTALGLATNATAVTFDGNISNTLIKMIATVADVSRGGTDDIFILTNTAGAIALEGERFLNSAHKDLVKILGPGVFLESLPLIQENVIVTSGSSPNKTAPLYVGKKGDYLMGVQTDPRIEMDKFSDFKAAGETARIMSFWDGKPHFNDSFAKTTIPTIY